MKPKFVVGGLVILLALAYLIVFGSLIAFTAYIWLLNHVSISTVSTTAYVNPIVAVALGAIILSEPMTPRTWSKDFPSACV